MIEIHGRLTLSHAMRKAFRVLSSITGDPDGESALTASLSVAVDQLELDLIADDQVLIAQDLADVHEDVDVRPSRRC
jgi:hypothetical protein